MFLVGLMEVLEPVKPLCDGRYAIHGSKVDGVKKRKILPLATVIGDHLNSATSQIIPQGISRRKILPRGSLEPLPLYWRYENVSASATLLGCFLLPKLGCN